MAAWHADFFVGEWRVSPKLSKITKDGQAVGVKQKSVAVLACLADASGEVVSRNDIMDVVWPGMTVTDDVLTQSIVELRKVFADDAKHPQVIETIPRVGFRLIAPVAPVGENSDQGPRVAVVSESSRRVNTDATVIPGTARRYGFIAVAVLVVGTALWSFFSRPESPRQPVITIEEPPSIAVLPFVNMSDDPGNEYFSDGLSEEILSLLARIPDLKVIGRTSSFAFKGKNEDLRVIGQTLGVTTVLEGSVRKSGDRVRITAQLIDVSDGTHIWAATYDRTMTEIFAVQDDVAAAIIDALQIHVGTLPTRGRPTESPEAYALVLKARAAVNIFDWRDAGALLLEAIELDPNFAEAYEMLALTYWNRTGADIDVIEAASLARAAAAKAIAIDPDLAFAQALYRASEFGPYLRVRKLEAFEQAAHKQPGNPWVLDALIFSLMENGYLEEALYFAKRYVELDPLSLLAISHWSAALYAVGRTSEAIAAMEFADQMDLDPSAWKWTMAGVNLAEGRDEIAIAHFESYLQQRDYPDSTWVRELVTNARDPVTGQAYLDRRIPEIVAALAELDEFDWQNGMTSFYLFFGFLDRHFELILATEPSDVRWHDAGIHLWRGNIFRRLGFAAHPKYLEVVKLLGTVDVWEQRGPPDFCEKQNGDWVCE